MDKPLVSIALATYNGSRFLKQQLDSLIAQDYPNLEIVISDDCSDDGTWEILSYYAQSDKRIRLLPKDRNIGYVKNFMRVFLACEGVFIAPCDQDDIWCSNKISRLVSNIGNFALIYSDNIFIDEYDNSLGKNFSSTVKCMHSGYDCRNFLFCSTAPGHTMLFRKHLLDKIINIDLIIAIDWSIVFLAAEHGGIFYLNEALVQWRQHEGSASYITRQKTQHMRSLNIEQTGKMLYFFTGLNNKHHFFIQEAYDAWNNWENSYFSFQLFIFIMRNKHITHGCSLVANPALKYLVGQKLKRKLFPWYY